MPQATTNSPRLSRFLANLIGAAGLLAVTSGTALGQATFRPLGSIIPGDASWAYDVSADGSVVVGRSGTNYYYGSSGHSYRWSSSDGMQDLDALVGDASAYGISADGLTIVGYENQGSRGKRAFTWTAATGMRHVYKDGMLMGIASGAGFCVGYDVIGGQPYNRAVRWTMGTSTLDTLDTLGLTTSSESLASSSDGSVAVGWAYYSALGQRAFRWTAATGMVNLGSPFFGGPTSEAHAVSDDGSVVVGAMGAVGVSRHAFRWTDAGGMQDLGVPNFPNTSSSIAYGISADGSTIVGAGESYPGTSNHAFIWRSPSGLQSLQTVLAGLLPAGWTVTEAHAASADGHTIVGMATNQVGLVQAWVATVPDCVPASVTGQPADAHLHPGQNTTFVAEAGGTAPFTYQWRKDGANIDGATGTLLAITGAGAADAGAYDCVISNGCNSATTIAAGLTVCAADFNLDGFVDGLDYDQFNNAFANPDPAQQMAADFNGDGFVDGIDYDQFNNAFETGC